MFTVRQIAEPYYRIPSTIHADAFASHVEANTKGSILHIEYPESSVQEKKWGNSCASADRSQGKMW